MGLKQEQLDHVAPDALNFHFQRMESSKDELRKHSENKINIVSFQGE
jgi:hypothetical protein